MEASQHRATRAASMSRAARVMRGAAGAAIASLFAAASHSLAGGDIAWLAVVATIVVALPLCVALAGRTASLWRLTVAVCSAQFLYHWTFAGLGAASVPTTGDPAPLHAGHGASLHVMTVVGGAEAAMWVGHAVAALITIALIHSGERAARAVVRTLRDALHTPRLSLTSARQEARAPRAAVHTHPALATRLLSLAAITHRGPPVAA